MGQRPSHQVGGGINKRLPFFFLRGPHTARNPKPEQPIKFQYKTRRKSRDLHQEANNKGTSPNSVNSPQTLNNLGKPKQSNVYSVKNTNEVKCKLVKAQNVPLRAKSEPSLVPERSRVKHRHRRKSTMTKSDWSEDVQQFGYEIQDVDGFLTKATIEKPANIPVVLASPSVLYQTRIGGYQAEISLPLGMVVNAVFKNQHWLYVQTPHAEEGYVSYAACLPLGIIPPKDDRPDKPCWEKSTDVFPKPSGNMTDTEKLSSKSDCGGRERCRNRFRHAASTCGERSVDRLYLRAAAIAKTRGIRHTLLVIITDFEGSGDNSITVRKGEVVFLLDANVKGWFYVRNKDGAEGFIPAAVAGHGFL
ncbi:hypothetical protein NQ317_002938 [Molorchus minor]|uniref:SH3 domain-containing protein n=1 Tax=Molorchus minor TaxID=1323400 RepID=A0ABQ9J2D5_9CUCU|nr:hypothetical protein NQ317_002938 [Molorchus minor]